MIRTVFLTLFLVAAVNCASNKKSDTLLTIISDSNDKCSHIKGLQRFDFKSFLGSQYKLEYFSDIPEAQDYESGSQITQAINKKWYFSFTINKKNGSQENFMYVIDRIDGSTIYETLLVNGERSQKTYLLKIYGYEAHTYIQFVVCGQETNPELRFALSYGDIELSDEQRNEIKSNDKNMKFNSKLLAAGKQSKDSNNDDRGGGSKGDNGKGGGGKGDNGKGDGGKGDNGNGDGHKGKGDNGDGDKGDGGKGNSDKGKDDKDDGDKGKDDKGDDDNGDGRKGKGDKGHNHKGKGGKGHNHKGKGDKGHNHKGKGDKGDDDNGDGHKGKGDKGHNGKGDKGDGDKGHNHKGKGDKGHNHKGKGDKGKGDKGHNHKGKGGGDKGDGHKGKGGNDDDNGGDGGKGDQDNNGKGSIFDGDFVQIFLRKKIKN